MELEILHTNVFERNLEQYQLGKRFICNQGGSRSSKSFSILQLLIFICLTKKGIKISIVRKSFPSLRGSILKDFMEIMDSLNLYDVKNHNKTENYYKFMNGSIIEFFSVDDSKKVRGRKRDICYCNEGNELSFEEFQQLSLRTTSTLFIDFNPSDDDHWVYDLQNDERSCLIKSTYKDNTFLHKDIIIEIENLINVDPMYYKIYALGEKPTSNAKIYTHFKQYTDYVDCKDWSYGLDIGFVHMAALVKSKFDGNKIYVEELIYEKGLTTDELCRKVKDIVIDNKIIYVDSARPDIIEQLKRFGLNAKSSDKQVKEGIDYVRSKEIYIHYESLNIWKEYKNYLYKSNGDKITEDPIKLNDDLMDALRYSIYSSRKNTMNLNRIKFY
jgi:phage terminase large subunit